MQNNTPFSRDPTLNLTQTILSVINEGQAYSGDPPYSGVERRAKSGPNQRNTKGSSRTEYNHFEGVYRPSGEQDRYYAKQRAEAKAKAKKTTTVEEQKYIEEYIAMLESALESIAEELECSVEDLLEDVQTRGRYLQVDPKATHSERLADSKGRKERKSKKVYGMHGKELAPSAAAYFKKHPSASGLLHNPSTAGD